MINRNAHLRKFGLVLGAIIATLFGLLPLLFGASASQVALVIAAILISIALACPKALGPVQRWWIKLGHFLGALNTGIILGLIFFFIFTPIAIFRKLLRKDPLELKIKSTTNTHRIEHRNSMSSDMMERMY